MIYTLNESTLKDAKLYINKLNAGKENTIKDTILQHITNILSKQVKSKYCYKNDNYHLALLLTKIAIDEEIKLYSNKTKNDLKYYDDNIIDSVINDNEDSIEKILCYILKYDKYLKYLPIYPIDNYNINNVKQYYSKIGGNTNIGVYEALMDHIIRYLPIKIQSIEWLKKIPSKLKHDYNTDIKNETEFLSILNTYNTLDDDIKSSIYKIYFGDKDETGIISRFNNFNEFLTDLKNKLSSDNAIQKIVNDIEEFGKNNIKIVYNNDNILIAVVYTYKASVKFGSDTSWCISDANSNFRFNQYCGYSTNNKQFFIWDFNLEPTNKLFRIGITIKYNGDIYTAHDKMDNYISDVDNYLNNKNIPFKKIFTPLSESEKKIIKKIEDLNIEFNNAIETKDYKIIKKIYVNSKDYIYSNNFEGFYKMVFFVGDIEMFDILLKTNKINNKNISKYLYNINIENTLFLNHLLTIKNLFKITDDNNLYDLVDFIVKLPLDYFIKYVNLIKELNDDENFLARFNRYIVNTDGIFDSIIENDDIELLLKYKSILNFDINRTFRSRKRSGTFTILELSYRLGQQENHDKLLKIAKYSIDNGGVDNGIYIKYCYENNKEFFNKLIENGFEYKNVIEYYIRIDDKRLNLISFLNDIKFNYDYNKENYNDFYMIYYKIFKNYDIDTINYILNKNKNIIYYKEYNNEYYQQPKDNNIYYYLTKETNTNNIINIFNELPNIYKEFNAHPKYIKYVNDLFFEYSAINKVLFIFKNTIADNTVNYIKYFDFNSGNYNEFIKIIITDDFKKLTTENILKIYYNENYNFKKDIIDNITSKYILEIISMDIKKELLNELINNNVINSEIINKLDITPGIYTKTIDSLKLIYDKFNYKTKPDDIYKFLSYGLDIKKSDTSKDEYDIKIKECVEFLHKKGSDINGKYFGDNLSVLKSIENGLYYTTKYLIDNGAIYNIVKIKPNIFYSNNIKLFNYAISELNIKFNNIDINSFKINNIKPLYQVSFEYYKLILDYIKNNNLKFDYNNFIIVLIDKYSEKINLIKNCYDYINDNISTELDSTTILKVSCFNIKGSHDDNNELLTIFKWLVEEKNADYNYVYDLYKKKKLFTENIREYFKSKIKQTKLKESYIMDYNVFINQI